MKERPILFSSEMVKAILDGKKTMTRRVIKPQPASCSQNPGNVTGNHIKYCPYEVGMKLWVRETWYPMQDVELSAIDNSPIEIVYKADWDRDGTTIEEAHDVGVYWKPSIFMPRWASRVNLEIATNIRVERLQEISEDDCWYEGIRLGGVVMNTLGYRDLFADLWNSINAKRGFPWKSNPWVWIIEFRMLEESS